jgi:hypothetical protein
MTIELINDEVDKLTSEIDIHLAPQQAHATNHSAITHTHIIIFNQSASSSETKLYYMLQCASRLASFKSSLLAQSVSYVVSTWTSITIICSSWSFKQGGLNCSSLSQSWLYP